MAIASIVDSRIVQRLVDAGIIPNNCSKCRLILDAHMPVTLQTEVFVTPEQFEILCQTLLDNKAELGHETIVKSLFTDGLHQRTFRANYGDD